MRASFELTCSGNARRERGKENRPQSRHERERSDADADSEENKTALKVKKPLLLFLALGAPVGFFLAFYLDGWRFIPQGSGFLSAAASMFLLPFAVALFLATRCTKSASRRNLVLFGTLILQFALIFTMVPPGARVEMIGIGQRLKKNFPVQTLQACAAELLQKYRHGTLATNPAPSTVYPPIAHATAVVSDSELPEALKGKFRCVAIQTNEANPLVIFEVEPQIGILCGTKQFGEGFFHYRISDGVYAYHYERP